MPSTHRPVPLAFLFMLALPGALAIPGRTSAQVPELLATLTGAVAETRLGLELAIDGDTVAIGSDGRVDVYRIVGRSLELEQSLTPPGPPSSWTAFGGELGLDGDWIAVGAQFADGDVGAVFVYHRTGTRWSMTQRITPPEDPSSGGLFGRRPRLRGDVLIVSRWYYRRGTRRHGRLYVYQRDPTGQYHYDQPLDALSDHLCGTDPCSVPEEPFWGATFDFDGTTLAVGGWNPEGVTMFDLTGEDAYDASPPNIHFDAGRFVPRPASVTSYVQFGFDVALAQDQLFVGGNHATVSGLLNAGQAFLLTRTTGDLEAVFPETSPHAGSLWGATIASSRDGQKVALSGDRSGSVQLAERAGTDWITQELSPPSDASAATLFGLRAVVDGAYVVVSESAWGSGVGTNLGRVHLYGPRTAAPDAGVLDAGVSDAGLSDAGLSDAGPIDGGLSEAGMVDAGMTDVRDAAMLAPDGSLADDASPPPLDAAASPDDAATRADARAGSTDAGTYTRTPLSCTCRAAGMGARHDAPAAAVGLLLLLFGLSRRSARANAARTVPLMMIAIVVTTIAGARAQAQAEPEQASAASDEATAAVTDPESLREAQIRFDLGRTFYDQGRFAEAAAEFQRAYDLSRRSGFLYNIHVAWRDAGQVGPAARALRAYLDSDVTIDPALRRTLERRLAAMQDSLAQIAHADETEATHTEPTPPATDVSAIETAGDDGEHGHAASSSETVGQRGEARAPEPVARDEGLSVVPGAVVLGTGGAALAVSAILGAVALGVAGDRDATCSLGPSTNECPASYDEAPAVSQFHTLRDTAWAVGVVGGAMVLGGAVLVAIGATDDHDVPASVACGPSGCSVALRGTF